MIELPDDYGDRCTALDQFVSCPDCTSTRASIEVATADLHEQDIPLETAIIDLRAVCPDCGHETPWVHNIGEVRWLSEALDGGEN